MTVPLSPILFQRPNRVCMTGQQVVASFASKFRKSCRMLAAPDNHSMDARYEVGRLIHQCNDMFQTHLTFASNKHELTEAVVQVGIKPVVKSMPQISGKSLKPGLCGLYQMVKAQNGSGRIFELPATTLNRSYSYLFRYSNETYRRCWSLTSFLNSIICTGGIKI
jgi:hypothetical protein